MTAVPSGAGHAAPGPTPRSTRRAAPRGSPGLRSATFSALDFTFSLDEDDPRCFEAAAAALAPLQVGDPGAPCPRYSIRRDGGERFVVVGDGEVLDRGDGARHALDWLLWHVNQSVAAASGRYVLLHAAAVEIDGQAVVLPGSSGAGKSTLCAALVLAGAGYLTDELTALEPGATVVIPFAKSIALDRASLDVLGLVGGSGVTHLAPDALRAGAASPSCEPGLVAFPRRDPAASTRLVRLSGADAPLEALTHTVNLDDHGGLGMQALAALVGRVPCYALEYSDALDAAGALGEVARQLR